MSANQRSARAPAFGRADHNEDTPRAGVRAPARDVGDYDAADLQAGPDRLRAAVRVDDPRWGEVNAMTLADIALTALGQSPRAPAHPVSFDLLFSDDGALARLNAQFRGKSGPTNVLSFPAEGAHDDHGTCFLGSIALAFDTCEAEARISGINFAHHATHLIVHGALHLLGFDHEDEAAADVMERIEVETLAMLGIANPYEGK